MYRGLPRAMYVLFFSQIVNSLGNFVFPFLTLLLTQKAGFSAAATGRIIMISAISFVPGSLLGGRLADRRGRKSVMVAGFLISAGSFLACGFVDDMYLLPYFIVVAQAAFGLVEPTLQALIVDVTTPQNRQAAFSLTYLGHNIGFSVGPLVAGFLFTYNYRILFFGDAVTTIIAVTLVALFVKESRPTAEQIEEIGRENPHEAAEEGGILGVLLRRPLLVAFMLANLVIMLVYSQYTFSLPLQMNEVFGDRGARFYGIVMTMNAVTVVWLTPLLISATRKIRPLSSVALAGALFAVGFGVLGLGTNLAFFLAMTLVWTAGEVLQATNVDVYVANHTPAGHRGRMNSLSPIIIGAGFALGPMLGGIFVDTWGVSQIWPVSAGILLFAMVVLLVLRVVEPGGSPLAAAYADPHDRSQDRSTRS